MFIEIPKGSRNKYEYDAELGGIKLDRFLFSSITYPADYGFFPDTEGEDGDALDAIMLVDKPTFPGCRVDVRPVAVLRLKADEGSDDKVVCVPYKDPAWAEYETLDGHPAPAPARDRALLLDLQGARGPQRRAAGLRGPRRGRAAGRRGARAVQ